MKIFYLFLILIISACSFKSKKELAKEKHLKTFDQYKTPAPASLQKIPHIILSKDSTNTLLCSTDSMSRLSKGKTAFIFFDPSCVECNMLGNQFNSFSDKINSDFHLIFINLLPTTWSSFQNYKNTYFAKISNAEFYQVNNTSDLSPFGTISLTPTLFIFENGVYKEKHEVGLNDQDFKKIFLK